MKSTRSTAIAYAKIVAFFLALALGTAVLIGAFASLELRGNASGQNSVAVTLISAPTVEPTRLEAAAHRIGNNHCYAPLAVFDSGRRTAVNTGQGC